MKLDLEKIMSITRGVERIERKDNYFTFHRFNLEEEKLYSTRNFV